MKRKKKSSQKTHGYRNYEQRCNSVTKRQEQVGYFDVSLLGEPKNFLHENMGKIEALVF